VARREAMVRRVVRSSQGWKQQKGRVQVQALGEGGRPVE